MDLNVSELIRFLSYLNLQDCKQRLISTSIEYGNILMVVGFLPVIVGTIHYIAR